MTEEFAESAVAEPIVESPEAPQDAPETSDAPVEAPSRRDALERALDSVNDAEEAATGDRARGPDGKFVAKDTQDTAPEAAKPDEAKPEDAKPDDNKALAEPPSRFSPDAKAAWASAPPAVQGEIKRAITEMEQGLAQKDATLEPLKPFMEMAQKSGTTVEAALANYVNLEQLLARDPRAGFERLAQNMGKTLPDMIAQISGTESQSTDKDREILTLRSEIDALKGQFGQVNQTIQQQQTSQVEAQVTAFAAENPRFEELSGEVARLLETGYASDLAGAYKIAEQLNPLTVAPPATPAPAQTRVPKSVTGSPSAGSTPANARPSGTRSEALQRAMAQAGL